MAVHSQGCVPAPYQPRRPADTPLYRVVQNHLETFIVLSHSEWEEEHLSPHADSNFHFAEYRLRKLQIQPVGAASSRDRTPVADCRPTDRGYKPLPRLCG